METIKIIKTAGVDKSFRKNGNFTMVKFTRYTVRKNGRDIESFKRKRDAVEKMNSLKISETAKS